MNPNASTDTIKIELMENPPQEATEEIIDLCDLVKFIIPTITARCMHAAMCMHEQSGHQCNFCKPGALLCYMTYLDNHWGSYMPG